MEPREGMAILREAFIAGLFIGNGVRFKNVVCLEKGAHYGKGNLQSVKRLRGGQEVESWAATQNSPAFLGLVFSLFKRCSVPNWGVFVVGKAQLHCWTSSVGERNKSLVAVMVQERMPCRRGTWRGESSRPPVADIHHHGCCCYCHRRMGATPIQPCQVMEVGISSGGEHKLPAFGSVIFTLGSSGDNPGINAHISVLFTQIEEENAEELSLVLAEDNVVHGKGKIPMGELSTEAEGSASGRGNLPVGESASEESNSGSDRSQSPSQPRAPEQPEPVHNPSAMEEEPED